MKIRLRKEKINIKKRNKKYEKDENKEEEEEEEDIMTKSESRLEDKDVALEVHRRD